MTISGPFLALPQEDYNYVRASCLGKHLSSLRHVTKNHIQIHRSRRVSTGRNAHSKSFQQTLLTQNELAPEATHKWRCWCYQWQMAEGAKIFVRSSAPYRVNNMLHQHLLLRTMPSNTQTEVYSGYPAPHKTSSQHTLNRVPVGLLATNMKRKCNLHERKSRGRDKWNSCHAMLVHEIKQLRKICTASKKDINDAVPPWLLLHTTEARLHKFTSTGTHGTK